MHLMLDFSYNLDSVFSHELCKSAFSDGIFWDSGVEPHLQENPRDNGGFFTLSVYILKRKLKLFNFIINNYLSIFHILQAEPCSDKSG